MQIRVKESLFTFLGVPNPFTPSKCLKRYVCIGILIQGFVL